MKAQTIPLVNVYEAFQQHGFTEDEITNILIGMVMIWQVNEPINEITKEVVFTECDMDELNAQLLWNAIGNELVRVAYLFRDVRNSQVLLRWSIQVRNIILELAE